MGNTSEEHASIALSEGERVLDRYRVDERVAIGGHSVVFRGEDERLARPVCIKVFDKLEGDERVWRTAYEHFVQEAFALSRLTHPNTLRIYDFGHIARDGEEVGVPVQVSEYMNGGNLAQLVRRSGPLPIDEAVRVMTTVCDALAEAHTCGIVHRDIKPQNILFGAVGSSRQPKLADFGIAKSFVQDGASLANQAGDTAVVAGFPMVMYSPSWAAPEQLAGEPAQGAADLYSLAAVAVYTMTGRVVLRADDVNEGYERRRTSDELIDGAFSGSDAPPALVALLKQACSFDPERRPRDAAAFAQALGDALTAPRGVAVGEISVPLPPPPSTRPVEVDTEVEVDLAEGTEAPTAARAPRQPPILAPASGGGSAHGSRPRRLVPGVGAVDVARRSCHFLPAEGGTTQIAIGGQRVRITLTPAAPGRMSVHMRGLSCFVSRDGGRPSSAVSFDSDAAVALVTPRNEPLAAFKVSFGRPAAGHTVFHLDDESVAIGVRDCPEVVMVDAGRGGDCIFVHPAPASSDPAPGRRWRRSNDHER